MKLQQRQAQREVMLGLTISVDRFIADNPGVTRGQIEKDQGMTEGTLSVQLGEHNPLTVATLVQTMEAMDGEYLEALDALEHRFGRRGVSVVGAKGSDLATVTEAASRALTAHAEAMTVVMKGAADGRLDAEEVRAALAAIDKVQARLDAQRAALLGLKG